MGARRKEGGYIILERGGKPAMLGFVSAGDFLACRFFALYSFGWKMKGRKETTKRGATSCTGDS